MSATTLDHARSWLRETFPENTSISHASADLIEAFIELFYDTGAEGFTTDYANR